MKDPCLPGPPVARRSRVLRDRLQTPLGGSIQRNMVLGMAFLFSALTAIFVVLVIRQQRDYMFRQNAEQAATLARTLSVNSIAWVKAGDAAGLQDLMGALASYPDLHYAMVLAPDGRIIAHTRATMVGSYANDLTSRSVLSGPPQERILSKDPSLIDAASPIMAANRCIGWARIGLGQERDAAALDGLTRTGLLYSLFAAVVGIAFAYVMARGLTRGLAQLIRRTEQIRAGNLAARSRLDRSDELGRLASAFDSMAEDLGHASVALKESESLYRSVVTAMVEGVVLQTDTGEITAANPAAERILGVTHDELLGRTSDRPPWPTIREDGSAFPGECHPSMVALRTGESQSNVVMGICKSGGVVTWISINAQPLVQWDGPARGRPHAVVTTFHDVTDTRQAELELRIAASAFESQEGMLITDANKIILRVNRAFCEITGYAAQEVLGKTPRVLKSGRHDASFYAAMWECINRTGTWKGEVWNRRKNGEIYPEWLSISAVAGKDRAVTHYVGTQIDLTARVAAEEEIRHLAFYDALTRLPNRRLLRDRLQQIIVTNVRTGRKGALLFIDLDNFKTLNDTRGHDVGDQLLQQVAQRLSACVREGDSVARFGGDEFLVILQDLSEELGEAAGHAELVGEKILHALNQPYRLDCSEYQTTSSIGVALFGGRRETVEDLFKQADLAMYQAKSAGRNALRFFDPNMQTKITARAALDADLRVALAERQFELYYQPQVDVEGVLLGAEALLRWRHPTRGLVTPDEFIPLAEDTGLIVPIGLWVLECACLQLVAWAARKQTAQLTVAVNVSPREFRQPEFSERLLATLDRTGADPRGLKLELTEGLLLDDLESVIDKMTALKARGVSFSLDDFGTGYSSLAYLKRLPLDQLKIDQSFVRNVLIDSNDAAIARTIVALAHSMGLSVIAEGVESEAQREFLALQGCWIYQGYLYGAPMSIAEFERAQRCCA